jgi:hypothetical protein
MEDASEEMLQIYKENHVELYKIIDRELKEVQRVVRLVCVVPTVPSAPSSSHTAELGDKPTQLRILSNVIEARFHRAQEEKEKAIESLQNEKDEVLVKL